jgi:hypothetical protein
VSSITGISVCVYLIRQSLVNTKQRKALVIL